MMTSVPASPVLQQAHVLPHLMTESSPVHGASLSSKMIRQQRVERLEKITGMARKLELWIASGPIDDSAVAGNREVTGNRLVIVTGAPRPGLGMVQARITA
jgi:hypothetical protein